MKLIDRLVEVKADLFCARRYGFASPDSITQIHIDAAERGLDEIIAEMRAEERAPFTPRLIFKAADVLPLQRTDVLNGDGGGEAA